MFWNRGEMVGLATWQKMGWAAGHFLGNWVICCRSCSHRRHHCVEIRATWWVRSTLPLRTSKGQTTHMTLPPPTMAGLLDPSYSTHPQTHWHFVTPNYLHWMTVHQGLPQPSPSWGCNVVQSHVFDCEEWFPAGGWLMSLRDRAVLMAEGQSGKGEDRELEGSILTRGRQSERQHLQHGRYQLDKESELGSHPRCLPSLLLLLLRPETFCLVLSSLPCISAPLFLDPCSSHMDYRGSLPPGSTITVSSLQTTWGPDGVERALGVLESRQKPDLSLLPCHVTT